MERIIAETLGEFLNLGGVSAKEAAELKPVKSWFHFAETIYDLEKSRRRGGTQDAQKIATEFNNIKNTIAKLQDKLKEENGLNVISIRRAKETIEHLAGLERPPALAGQRRSLRPRRFAGRLLPGSWGRSLGRAPLVGLEPVGLEPVDLGRASAGLD